MQKVLKNNQGVTLIALVITIVILIILAGVSMIMVLGNNGIFEQAKKGANAMAEAEVNTQKGFNSMSSEIDKILNGNGSSEQPEKVTEEKPNAPKKIYGMSPIKFVEPTDTEKGQVVDTDWNDNSWYNYKQNKWANTKTQDGSMWVWIPRYAYKITYTNPSDKSQGGSIDVKFLIGTSDDYYDEESKTIKTAKRVTTKEEVADTTTDYYVHPAFTNESSIDFANGGWDKELEGMYVAKFEAGFPEGNNTAPNKKSSQTYSQETGWVRAVEAGTSGDSTQPARNWLDGIYDKTATRISYPVFQPLTYSMNYINHNDAYNISKAMNEEGNIYGFNSNSSDTHLIKSSEWGMVSYLTHSKYGIDGKNGNEIAVNNASLNSGDRKRTETAGKSGVDSVYGITGMTQGNTDGPETIVKIDEIRALQANTPTPTGNMYAWNQKGGITASTTGNMTGVYDLSGGGWERVTSYIANENKNLSTYGKLIAYNGDILKTESTKYTMVYPHDSTLDNKDVTITEENLNKAREANYKKNLKIYGDAIRETSMLGTANTSWNGDYSGFASLSNPFVRSGGNFWNNSGAGRFCFDSYDGDSTYSGGIRPIVIPIS